MNLIPLHSIIIQVRKANGKKAEILQKIQANNLKILELNRQNQQLANQL
jgi:hypothetical protein